MVEGEKKTDPKEKKLFGKIILWAMSFWTVAIFVSLAWNSYHEREQILEIADKEASLVLEKDTSLREWISQKGGLYIRKPNSDQESPNTGHFSNQEILLPDGTKLTLYDPISLSKEIYKLEKQNIEIKLISIQRLQAGDVESWEKEALEHVLRTKSEFTTRTEQAGTAFIRKMHPVYAQKDCFKCHNWKESQLNEVVGGVSYSFPLVRHYRLISESIAMLSVSHLGIWVFGLVIIFLFSRRIRTILKKLDQNEKKNQSLTDLVSKILENIPDGILVYEAESGKCVLVNESAAQIVGGKQEEMLSMNYKTIKSWEASGLSDAAQYAIESGENIPGESYIETTFDKKIWVETVFTTFEYRGSKHLLLIMNDITERKISEMELRKLWTAIEQSPTSVVITDLDANIEYVNPKFTEITGYNVNETLGKNPKVLQSGLTKPELYREMWDTLVKGETWIGEFVNKRKNGEMFYEQALIAPVRMSGGVVTNYVAIKIDITDRKKMELALIQSKEEAEKANKAKSEFLATMSHEIRTPIHGILGFNELLMNSNPSPEQLVQIQMISESGKNLLGVINNILYIAELENEKLNTELTDFLIDEVFESIRRDYKEKVDEKGLEFHFSVERGNILCLRADVRRIRQVLDRLFENALKFTESGFIQIEIKIETKEKAGEVRIRGKVADSGKGVIKEYQPRIFDVFSQENSSITRKYGGAGLGLAICKKLTHAMGGDVVVESDGVKGSVFTFWVDCLEAQTCETLDPSPLKDIPTDRVKLLVAEDDKMNQKIILKFLNTQGYKNIVMAADGKIALEEYKKQKFDMVLTDLHMPNMNGFELAQKILNDHNPKALIVAITADAYEDTRNKCLEIGMKGFITKPFTPKLLKDTIQAILVHS